MLKAHQCRSSKFE